MLETVVKGVKQTFGDKYQVFLVPDPDSEEADPKGGPRRVAYAKLVAVTIMACLQSIITRLHWSKSPLQPQRAKPSSANL